MPDYDSSYERHRMALLASTIPAGSGLAVDVGCNDGTVTNLLVEKGYDAIGIDIDAGAIERGRALYPSLDLRHGSESDAAALSPRALTLCVELLEHLQPDAQLRFLQSIAAATAPGGRLVLSTPGRFSLFSIYERLRGPGRHYDWWDPTHLGVVSWRRLRAMLKEARFGIEHVTGYHYLPESIVTPFGCHWGPVARMGFDLVVTAVRR